jgi:AcrR family transcriptional regulator
VTTGHAEPPQAEPRADARRNREAVLEAAAVLLSNRPDASMREVAEASGLGRTTVYRHFPTREDLVAGLFARVIHESHAMSESLIEAGLPPADLLREVGRRAVEIGQRYRFLAAHRDIGESAMAAAEEEESDDPMIEYLRSAQARGELSPDLPPEWLFAMLRGVIVAAVDEVVAERVPTDEAARNVGKTLVGALGVRERPS